jgi:hypothetical protein
MNGSELIEEESDLGKSHTPLYREPGTEISSVRRLRFLIYKWKET